MRKNLLIIPLLLTVVSCNKDKMDENPFENETVLDCRNLKVRNVEYTVLLNTPTRIKKIYVSIENTCKACTGGFVYLDLYMIDKTTGDTVARTPCLSCAIGINNKETGIYELETSLTGLPDLKNLRFDYSYLCHDVPYEPKK